MKICIILGTRPEIIKLYSTIKYCEDNKLDYFVIHTGQHYSYNMDELFFKELGLPNPKYNLQVGSGTHGAQTGKMMIAVEEVLMKEKPDVVIVQGDTNSTFVGAVCAAKLWIKVCHIEAGLRSYDRTMPEELNRIMVDSIADYLSCPTKNAERIALSEGIPKKKIWVTGSTLVDIIQDKLKISGEKSDIMGRMHMIKNKYILLTTHRQENVDNEKKLRGILEGVYRFSTIIDMPVIFPIHPRTKKNIEKFRIFIPECIRLIEPVGFFDFLQLEMNAGLILTDSGGIQEEACILKVPAVTLRENTERPETIEVGANMLAGTNPKTILRYSKEMIDRTRKWRNPFGGGKSAEITIQKLIQSFK